MARIRRASGGVHSVGSVVWRQGLTYIDACAAEAAFVDAVMQHLELPGSVIFLAHDLVSEFGSLGGREKSQDPRAFLPTLEQPHELPRSRPHCPTEGLAESTEDCVTLMPAKVWISLE